MKYISKISMVAVFLGCISSGFSKNLPPSFLTVNTAPNSLALLPLPPAPKSAAFLADQEAYKNGQKLQNTLRWQQAVTDADLSDANIGKPFSAALGVAISPMNTPITYDILKKLREDSIYYATASAKDHYMRIRPFVYYNTAATCYPKYDAELRKNGSYPSGHSTLGWATALILVEIRPERQAELLKRGYEFGQSRVICGAHWQSDVDAGRIMGAAAFARLNADPAFLAELAAAKKEIAAKIR